MEEQASSWQSTSARHGSGFLGPLSAVVMGVKTDVLGPLSAVFVSVKTEVNKSVAGLTCWHPWRHMSPRVCVQEGRLWVPSTLLNTSQASRMSPWMSACIVTLVSNAALSHNHNSGLSHNMPPVAGLHPISLVKCAGSRAGSFPCPMSMARMASYSATVTASQHITGGGAGQEATVSSGSDRNVQGRRVAAGITPGLCTQKRCGVVKRCCMRAHTCHTCATTQALDAHLENWRTLPQPHV